MLLKIFGKFGKICLDCAVKLGKFITLKFIMQAAVIEIVLEKMARVNRYDMLVAIVFASVNVSFLNLRKEQDYDQANFL